MEKQIQSIQTNSMKEYIEEQKVKIQETKEELDKIEQNLKNQSDTISKEITDIREKYGEEKLQEIAKVNATPDSQPPTTTGGAGEWKAQE